MMNCTVYHFCIQGNDLVDCYAGTAKEHNPLHRVLNVNCVKLNLKYFLDCNCTL